MRNLRIGAAAMMLTLSSCSGEPMDNGGICTASFATIPVTVVDDRGQPVAGAAVTATLVRTGQTLEPTTLMLTIPGTYVVIDDGSTHLLSRSGDAVQVRISKGAAAITADYVFAVPDGCHVSKVSGPNTVTLP
jgi:hypothetical protein